MRHGGKHGFDTHTHTETVYTYIYDGMRGCAGGVGWRSECGRYECECECECVSV